MVCQIICLFSLNLFDIFKIFTIDAQVFRKGKFEDITFFLLILFCKFYATQPHCQEVKLTTKYVLQVTSNHVLFFMRNKFVILKLYIKRT